MNRSLRSMLMVFSGLVFAVAFLPGASFGQSESDSEASASASINSSAVYVGDTLIYTLEVINAEPASPPTISSGTGLGFEAEFLRQQNRSFSSTVIVNGQVTETSSVSFVLYYQLRPLEAGQFEVPSVEVATDAGVLRTQPVSFRAVAATERDDLLAQLSVSSDAPFVGQPITVTLELFVATGGGLNNPVFALPGFDDRFSTREVPRTRGRRSRSGFDFLGAQADVEVERIERDGQLFDRVTTSREIVPTQSGTIELGPGVWICDFTPPGSRRAARVAVPTTSLVLTVRDLPDEGKPSDFTGLIGSYSIRARATPTSVRIGDPIRFELTLEGPGDLRELPAPELNDFSGFAEGFRLAERDTERQLGDGSVTFRYVLRTISDAVEAIPTVVLNSFDPERGEYTMLETDPIPLEVEPSRIVTAVDGEGFDRPASEAQRVISAPRTLSANRSSEALLRSERGTLSEAVRSPLVIGVAVAPPLAYFALLGVLAVRRRNERGPQPIDASSAARRCGAELRRAGSPPADALRDAFVRYESLRSAQSVRSVTPGDSVARIIREQPPLAPMATGLLEACDSVRFGGRADACGPSHIDRAIELFKAIEKQPTPPARVREGSSQ